MEGYIIDKVCQIKSIPLWMIKQVTDLSDENTERYVHLNKNIWKKNLSKGLSKFKDIYTGNS